MHETDFTDKLLAQVKEETLNRKPTLVDVGEGDFDRFNEEAIYTFLSPAIGDSAISIIRIGGSGYVQSRALGMRHIGIYFSLHGHDSVDVGSFRSIGVKEMVEFDGRFDEVWFVSEAGFAGLFNGKLKESFLSPEPVLNRSTIVDFIAQTVGLWSYEPAMSVFDPKWTKMYVSPEVREIGVELGEWALDNRFRKTVCFHPYMGINSRAITTEQCAEIVERLANAGVGCVIVGDSNIERHVLEVTPHTELTYEILWDDFNARMALLIGQGAVVDLRDRTFFPAFTAAAKSCGWCLTEFTKTIAMAEILGSGIVGMLEGMDGYAHVSSMECTTHYIRCDTLDDPVTPVVEQALAYNARAYYYKGLEVSRVGV